MIFGSGNERNITAYQWFLSKRFKKEEQQRNAKVLADKRLKRNEKLAEIRELTAEQSREARD